MKKALFHEKKSFPRFLRQDTQNDVKRPEKWFRKKVRMGTCVRACVRVYVCARARACVCVSNLRQIQASVSQISFARSS